MLCAPSAMAAKMPEVCQKALRRGAGIGKMAFSHEIKATIVTNDPSRSMVVLRDPRHKLNRYHRPGQMIGRKRQYLLCFVARDKILLLRKGRLGWVLGEDAEELVPVSRLPRVAGLAKRRRAKILTRGATRFRSMRRTELKRFLRRKVRNMGIRYKPFFRRGRPSGMHVTRVRRGSFLYRAGLRKGDILMRVNGRKVYSPSHAVRMMRRSRYLRGLNFKVKRRGRRYNFNFSLR